MDEPARTYQFSDLPETIPVFPLGGVLLLPRGQLPLNIFEPRYVAMVEDALRDRRVIGMIQPKRDASDAPPGQPAVPLYGVGCAGKITSFTETSDGRFLITLTGICRFRVSEELAADKPYRRVRADWSSYQGDFKPYDCLDMDRDRLRALLSGYFQMNELSCDWSQIDDAPDERLITCLSMICPLDAGEKQALLETPCCRDRAKLFMSMLDLAVRSGKTATLPACH